MMTPQALLPSLLPPMSLILPAACTSSGRGAVALTDDVVIGGPVASSSASSTTPLPEGVRVVDNVGLTVDGGGDNGRRACNHVGRERHDASPGGGEGRWQGRPQGRRGQRRQEGLRRPRLRAPQAPLPEGLTAAGDAGFMGGNDNGRIAYNAVHHERYGASPGGGESRW